MPRPKAQILLTPFQQDRLAAFDTLSADAIVDDPVAASVLNVSVLTLKQQNPIPRRQISSRMYGRRVGDIRAKVRGETVSA